MNTPTTNMRPQRKSLAAEIDRLDRVVEALEDGLKSTVAQVVREAVLVAVQQAIQAIIGEVLSQPELLRQLAGVTTPASPVHRTPVSPTPVQSPCASWQRKLGRGWNWLRTRVSDTGSLIRSKLPGMRQPLRAAGRKVWRHRGAVALSVGVGLLLGVGGYLSGPVVSSCALGLCSATLSAGAFVLSPIVRLWKSLQAQQG